MQASVLTIVRTPSNSYDEKNMSTLGLMSERSLAVHQRAITRAKIFLKAEVELIESLREVEDDRTYRHFNQTSIYEYAM